MKAGKGKYYVSELTKEEFELLEKDCLERGIQIAVEEDQDGNILDGHHRMEIAEKHGLEVETVVRKGWTEEQKWAHVYALQLGRRNLTPLRWGGWFKKLLEVRGVRREERARNDLTGATVASVAKEIGVPERTAKYRMTQHDDYELLDDEEQEAVDAGEKSVSAAARKKKQKKKRDETIKTAKLKGKFSVIYADPPWQYGASTVTGSAGQHYATMSTSEICEIPVRKHVTKDAVLFLWATNPMLPDALEVISAWGFKYKTNIVWVKDKATTGLGEYVRGKHELLLIATRGSMVPDKKLRPVSVIEAPRQEHSKKPGAVYRLIEKLYPGQVYHEEFCRGKARKGWSGRGAEEG